MASQSNAPIGATRLKQIATDACHSAIGSADFYEHAKVEHWNAAIINAILRALISEATPAGAPGPAHKFIVNATIVQHLVPTSALNRSKGTSSSASTGTGIGSGGQQEEQQQTSVSGMGAEQAGTSTDGKPHVGRRGMHSATQAFWNEKTDGMWSFKFDGGEAKGMDVVLSVIWVAV